MTIEYQNLAQIFYLTHRDSGEILFFKSISGG
jgi:hypothetical protein